MLENEIQRANHRHHRLVSVLLLCLGVVAAGLIGRPRLLRAQPAANAPKEVRANRFVLEDETGKTRAELSVYNGGPGLSMRDEKGTLRALLAVHNKGPQLNLFDEKGIPRAGMASFKDGPTFALYDEKETTRAGLRVIADGPDLALFDEKGTMRASLGGIKTTSSDGRVIAYPESSLLLFGPDGKVRWQTP